MSNTICLDAVSVQRIQLLHPKLRDEALQILTEITQALTGRAMFRVDSTLRTFAEQTKLYNQGRTTPGQKVTNSKAGQSYHNYGLALDGVFVLDGRTASWDFAKDFDNDGVADWKEVVNIFHKYNWVWGGDWTSFVDLPHFEKTFSHNWRDLLVLHDAGKVDARGYVII